MAEKSFMELVSSDDKVKIEVLAASYKALAKLAASKGFKDEAVKANKEAVEKVAEAHGYKSEELTELNDEQLKAASGGSTCFIMIGDYLWDENEHNTCGWIAGF